MLLIAGRVTQMMHRAAQCEAFVVRGCAVVGQYVPRT